MVILGLWISSYAPAYDEIMPHSLNEFIEPHTTKHLIINNRLIRIHAAIFNLLAKAAFANIKQWNGAFGCPHCMHPGEYDRLLSKTIYKPDVHG